MHKLPKGWKYNVHFTEIQSKIQNLLQRIYKSKHQLRTPDLLIVHTASNMPIDVNPDNDPAKHCRPWQNQRDSSDHTTVVWLVNQKFSSLNYWLVTDSVCTLFWGGWSNQTDNSPPHPPATPNDVLNADTRIIYKMPQGISVSPTLITKLEIKPHHFLCSPHHLLQLQHSSVVSDVAGVTTHIISVLTPLPTELCAGL